MRVRALGMIAAAGLLVGAGLPAESRGAPTTRLYDDIGDDFLVKPKRFGYGGATPGRNVGENFAFSKVRWRGWGRRQARGRGLVRLCPNMAPCKSRRVRLVALGRRRPGCAPKMRVYTRLRVRFDRPLNGRRGRRFDLRKATCR